MTSRFTDSVVVDGGGSGIEVARSRQFTVESATVVVADVSADAATAQCYRSTAMHPRRRTGLGWQSKFGSRYGGLDVAHNNAATDFEAMNAVCERYFFQPHPAQTTVNTILPIGLKIEIDVSAVLEGM